MYKYIKVAALFIPTVISIVLTIVVLLKIPEAKTAIQAMEIKMDSLVGIVGLAVSVWIGLNIYNVIEKKDLDDFKEQFEARTENTLVKLESTREDVEKQIQDLKDEILRENHELKKKLLKLNYNEFEVAITNIKGSNDIFQLSTDIKNELYNYLNNFFVSINIESIGRDMIYLGVKSTDEVSNNIIVVDLKEAITNKLRELDVTGNVQYYLCMRPIEMNI